MDVKRGTQVEVRVPPHQNNGDDVAMGFVTKVVGEDENQTVNVRALLDTGMDLRLTNIKLVDSKDDVEEEARDYDAPKVAWPFQ